MDFISRFIRAITELHPTHPMIVHFPIGLTGAAFLFILLAWWRKSDSLEKAAFYNLILAALSVIPAGITGIISNNVDYGGNAANAGVKIVLGIALFALAAGTAALRWRNPDLFQRRGKALYLLAYAVCFLLALALGFLGGVILYGF